MSSLDTRPPGTETQPCARRGRPRSDAADEAIRTAALELLVERGFEDMTMDLVAARAGVGKATVYRRYPSKIAMTLDAVKTLTDAAVPIPDNGNLRADLVEAYTAFLGLVCHGFGGALLVRLQAEAARDEHFKLAMQTIDDHRRESAYTILRQATARGELPADADLDLVYDLVPALVMHRLQKGTLTYTPADAGMLADLTLRAVGAA